jgi:hypothetical protein
MKTLILTFFLFISLGAGVPSALAQSTSKIAVVRLFESPRRLFLTYGEGKTEQQDLFSVVGKKDQKANTEQIQQLISRLYSEGYTLIDTFTGGTADEPVSTLLFRKE